MKKRMLALMMAVTLCSSLIGCGSQETEPPVEELEVTETEETEEVEAPVEVEEVVEEVTEAPAEPESLMGFNMIENGDFTGENLWFTYMNGGLCSMEIVDEQMVVDISNNGNVEHSVQIYYDGFKMVEGCEYNIQFDASSTIEREVEYRIQINGGDYHPYNSQYLVLTPEMQHYDITFVMEETTDPAPRLCFNMGFIHDVALEQHQVAFDNFELYCTDDSGRVDGGAGANLPKIQVNQIGYEPDAQKVAVLTGAEDTAFAIVDAETGETVYEGTPDAAMNNANTGRQEQRADFSDFTEPGTYKVVTENCGESYAFVIGEDVYADAFADTLKMFYMQRCGTELDAKYAGDYAHGVCHGTMATVYGTSTQKDVSGGWHDAGDYGRYVVAGAKAVADLLLAYEDYPEVFDDALGIPESGNGIPDVLDEARYELEWMLKMQEANGGVYHKVTCRNFPETVMPEMETEELVISPISNTATGDFAAVMAMAARVYETVDADFAASCLAAAEKAYGYLEANGPDGGFHNPSDVVTGEYGDANDADERFWAAAELYRTTGENAYLQKAKSLVQDHFSGLGWADVGGYGAYALLMSEDSSVAQQAKSILENGASYAIQNAEADTYYSSVANVYPWGSNMSIANNGMLCYMVGKDTYGKAQVDYLFGNNGTSYCFLTGYGTLSPEGTHHRPSQALGQTMPGMLVGGPNSNLEDPYAQAVLQGLPVALCYVDNEQSYSCNEITIYWNSPLVYIMAAEMSGK